MERTSSIWTTCRLRRIGERTTDNCYLGSWAIMSADFVRIAVKTSCGCFINQVICRSTSATPSRVWWQRNLRLHYPPKESSDNLLCVPGSIIFLSCDAATCKSRLMARAVDPCTGALQPAAAGQRVPRLAKDAEDIIDAEVHNFRHHHQPVNVNYWP